MKVKELLNLCEKSGHKVTKQGFYFSGKKYGFLTTNDSGKYEFDEGKFQEWIKSVTEEVPEGFLRMSDCAKMYKKSVTSIWLYCKEGNIEVKNFGAGKGIKYVNVKQLEKFIRINRNNSEEKNGK